MRAVGRSTSEAMNANDRSRVDGGAKILGLVTTRTKPARTKDGQSEGFRPCRQTSDPRRILGVLGNDVLDVGIYQNIYVRKQHPESPAAVPEPGLVIQFVERPRSVEIDAGAGVNAPHGHQPEGRLLRRFAALQSVVQCLGDKGR